MFDVDHDEERARAVAMEPNGFSFEGMDEGGMDYALNRCVHALQGPCQGGWLVWSVCGVLWLVCGVCFCVFVACVCALEL